MFSISSCRPVLPVLQSPPVLPDFLLRVANCSVCSVCVVYSFSDFCPCCWQVHHIEAAVSSGDKLIRDSIFSQLILAQESIHDEFLSKLKASYSSVKIDDPLKVQFIPLLFVSFF